MGTQPNNPVNCDNTLNLRSGGREKRNQSSPRMTKKNKLPSMNLLAQLNNLFR